jgi:hypothetical protein
MNFRKPLLTVAALLLTTGAIACSADFVAAPSLDDAQIDADIAATSGDAVASQVTSFGDNVAAAGSFSMVAPSYSVSGPGARLDGVPPTCSYASGRYSCAATTEQGLSVSRSFAFYNTQGQTVQNWDPTVVESVNFQAQVDGNFTKDFVWTAGVHRTQDVTVSGLISHSPQRTWNGSGTGHDTLSHVGLEGVRKLAGTADVAVTNVVMPGPDAASQIPLSGSIALDVDYTASLQGATGSVSRQVSRHVVVTFNGTNAAALQIGSMDCVLHLDTHSVDSCQ